ncbi:MAG: hypothetical protein V2B19_11150 [Pseudomonadota bacterium]
MILVDTSVLVDFFKGAKNDSVYCLIDVIKKQIPFGITAIVYQELLQGAKTKKESPLAPVIFAKITHGYPIASCRDARSCPVVFVRT